MLDTEPEDHLVVVVAHSLLGPVIACETAARTLLARGDQLSPETRTELLDYIVTRANMTAHALHDIVRGRPPELIEALDSLSATTPTQH